MMLRIDFAQEDKERTLGCSVKTIVLKLKAEKLPDVCLAVVLY